MLQQKTAHTVLFVPVFRLMAWAIQESLVLISKLAKGRQRANTVCDYKDYFHPADLLFAERGKSRMADDKFKLPGSSYEELTKIIKAYATCKGAAAPGDVGQRAVMDATAVSRNNGFLLDAGIVTGGNKKELTEQGRKLAGALDYEQPDVIRSAWREIVMASDFFQKVISAVRIRKGMEASSLRAHIAYSSGQLKSAKTTTGAGAVIDILVAAGLVLEQDGKFVALAGEYRVIDSSAVESGLMRPSDPTAASRPVVADAETGAVTILASPGVQIHIQLQCTPADIESLGPRLRKLLKDLSSGCEPSREGE
jgi:hypothetical protein